MPVNSEMVRGLSRAAFRMARSRMVVRYRPISEFRPAILMDFTRRRCLGQADMISPRVAGRLDHRCEPSRRARCAAGIRAPERISTTSTDQSAFSGSSIFAPIVSRLRSAGERSSGSNLSIPCRFSSLPDSDPLFVDFSMSRAFTVHVMTAPMRANSFSIGFGAGYPGPFGRRSASVIVGG